MRRQQLCVVVHDVAPATWPACERLLAMLDDLRVSPLTLLVVPDFHGTGQAVASPAFVRAIDRRRARGDEVALHGFFHRDDAPAPRTPLAWVRRRVLTAGEGEFAELGPDEARVRILRGLHQFASIGWKAEGFVAPGWLANEATRSVLRGIGLHWTSTHAALIDVARDRRIAAPCLTASPRTYWRRAASLAWLRVGARALSRQRLVRVGLHPADGDHPELMACWREVIARLLVQRDTVTKTQAIAASSVVEARTITQATFAGEAASPRQHHESRIETDRVAVHCVRAE